MTSRCDHSRWRASSFLTHSMLTSRAASCPLPPDQLISFIPTRHLSHKSLLFSALSPSHCPHCERPPLTTLNVCPPFVCQIYRAVFFFLFSVFPKHETHFCNKKKNPFYTQAPGLISCEHSFFFTTEELPFSYVVDRELYKGGALLVRLIFSLKHGSYVNPSAAQARPRARSKFTVKVRNFLLFYLPRSHFSNVSEHNVCL